MAEETINGLITRFKDQLSARVNYPGLWGYYSWNYEAAVALEALLIEDNDNDKDELMGCLQRALNFPHAGYFMKNNRRAEWMYSVGDRIGLFGALYKGVNDTVYDRTIKGVVGWHRHKGLFTRNIGWYVLFDLLLSVRFGFFNVFGNAWSDGV